MSGIAWAADAAAPAGAAVAGGGTLANILNYAPIILIFVVFYFLLIRPQQKKAKEHQQYLTALKKGDRVITGGGIHGVIAGLTDTVVTLEIAENVRIKISRAAIAGSASEAEKPAPAKSGG
jgi:preprotein translocase subunit YajC